MELKESLKEHRARLGLSQEELAERIFVSRQTISNWETGKTYPDVESLLRLSELFGTSVDELVKGDAAVMERTVADDTRKMTWLTWATCISIGLAVVFFVGLSAAWPELSGRGNLTRGTIAGAAVFVPLYAVGMACVLAIERIKRRHDLVTYSEIVAFSRGEALDEVRERGALARRHPVLGAALKIVTGIAAGAFIGVMLYRLL